MIKQTISYENYDGEPRTKDLYFHLSKSRIMDNLSLKDEFEELTENLAGEKRELKTEETQQILQLIKRIISLSYGERSEDGEYFRQSDEIYANFHDSPVYDAMLWHLFTDPSRALTFLKDIMPKDLMEKAQAELDEAGRKAPQDFKQKELPAPKAETHEVVDSPVEVETPDEIDARDAEIARLRAALEGETS